jgi:hypothetical protein
MMAAVMMIMMVITVVMIVMVRMVVTVMRPMMMGMAGIMRLLDQPFGERGLIGDRHGGGGGGEGRRLAKARKTEEGQKNWDCEEEFGLCAHLFLLV